MHGGNAALARQSPTSLRDGAFALPVTFDAWVGDRAIACVGTNAGASELAFQGWRRFKEAFAPELIARAVRESEIPVTRCLDPFGGSGTTALACQFLGLDPVTIEVNPYLADLIETKLASHDVSSLKKTFARIVSRVCHADVRSELRQLKLVAPATIVQPGVEGRYVFFRDVLGRLLAYRQVIEKIETPATRQFFRVLLGAVAVPVSNVTVSGKGRRYRGGWQKRRPRIVDVDRSFAQLVTLALDDIKKFGRRSHLNYTILRGDARQLVAKAGKVQLAVFSPPYPNSADYTDVYNVELWTMGYLKDWQDNRTLRLDTISSHVQLKRLYAGAPTESQALTDALAKLASQRSRLWHPDIPEMLGAYFADMKIILQSLHSQLVPKGKAYIVLGDSRYAQINIPTATIVATIAAANGYSVLGVEPFRSMRVAPQQGGKPGLAETLLILCRMP
jgi:hypothetical protein